MFTDLSESQLIQIANRIKNHTAIQNYVNKYFSAFDPEEIKDLDTEPEITHVEIIVSRRASSEEGQKTSIGANVDIHFAYPVFLTADRGDGIQNYITFDSQDIVSICGEDLFTDLEEEEV